MYELCFLQGTFSALVDKFLSIFVKMLTYFNKNKYNGTHADTPLCTLATLVLPPPQ